MAIDLNPAEALVYHPYADCFLVDGKLEESLAWVEKGAKLDPLSPLIVGPVIGHLQFLRRWDDVIEKSRNFQSMFPDARLFGIGSLRVALWHKELYVPAMDELRKEWKNDGSLLKAFEEGFAKAGPHGAMRAAAETLAARSRVRYQEPIAVAQFYAQAGDADSAFQWLERAFQERRPFLAHLKAEPSFDLIRSDPRFESILRRMNFPK